MKVYNYMIIMLTLMIFLYFLGFSPAGSQPILKDAGIEINSTTGELIEGDVGNSGWFNWVNVSIFGLALGTALTVGYFTRTFDWKILLVGFFSAFVFKFVTFGWGIIQLAKDTGESWLVAIMATIFLPLTVMFVFSIIEWFGGME
jgi:hypothetical protein